MIVDPGPDALDRAAYELVFEEDFQGPGLDGSRRIAHYLPHWTSPQRSAARLALQEGVLRLRIDADQPAWRVRRRAHWAPGSGSTASPDPTCMLALWLVGFEEAAPEQSGEICIAELFGNAIGPERSAVRMGVKAHHDPRLHDDMAEVVLDLDATAWHTYTAEWTADRIRFIDDRVIRSVHQGIHYPLQVMVDLFEFPADGGRDPSGYPKVGEVKAVRGYRRFRAG